MSTKPTPRIQPARKSKSAAGDKIRLELQRTEEEYKSSESDSDFQSDNEPMQVGSDDDEEDDDEEDHD